MTRSLKDAGTRVLMLLACVLTGAALTLAGTGCEEDGAEEVGEEIDEAIDEIDD